jgi:hypothetical protein
MGLCTKIHYRLMVLFRGMYDQVSQGWMWVWGMRIDKLLLGVVRICRRDLWRRAHVVGGGVVGRASMGVGGGPVVVICGWVGRVGGTLGVWVDHLHHRRRREQRLWRNWA